MSAFEDEYDDPDFHAVSGQVPPRPVRLRQGAGEDAAPPDRERAFLVFPRFTGLKPALGRTAAMARNAALLRTARPDAESFAQPSGSFDHGEETAEFRELAESAGAWVAGAMEQRRARPDPATLLGSGKVEELAGAAAAANASVVLVDYDLSPTQLRNLEDALPCPVIDRTQLILDIFARRAQTREGQLQVELAQLEYMLPRLTGRGSAMSQTGGGIGTRGPGETQLETDRRRIGKRLVILRRELERVRCVRRQQRSRRESAPVPTVALVGYTNAGKSTLFNALTGAGVLASSRMFATLDPKLRAVTLPSRRTAVLSDTVGFIRNLPTTLVSAFRATLEEVERAEVLLHIRDAADPLTEEHKLEVEKVLGELDVLAKPRIEVLNKLDRLPASEQAALLGSEAIAVSALRGTGLDRLLSAIDSALLADPLEEAAFWIPQSAGDALAALEQGGTVVERTFESRIREGSRTDGVCLRVTVPRSLAGRWRSYRVDEPRQSESVNPAQSPAAMLSQPGE